MEPLNMFAPLTTTSLFHFSSVLEIRGTTRYRGIERVCDLMVANMAFKAGMLYANHSATTTCEADDQRVQCLMCATRRQKTSWYGADVELDHGLVARLRETLVAHNVERKMPHASCGLRCDFLLAGAVPSFSARRYLGCHDLFS